MGDYALRNGLTDTDELDAVRAIVRGMAGHPARPGRDRPARSAIRVTARVGAAGCGCRFTRIPPPDLQPRIYDLDGRFLGRLDFYWDEFGVAGEADGRLKYLIDPDHRTVRSVLAREATPAAARRAAASSSSGGAALTWPTMSAPGRLASSRSSRGGSGAARPTGDGSSRRTPCTCPASFSEPAEQLTFAGRSRTRSSRSRGRAQAVRWCAWRGRGVLARASAVSSTLRRRTAPA